MGQVPSLVYLHQIELNFSSVIDINFAKSVQCPCSLGKSKKPHSFQSIKKLECNLENYLSQPNQTCFEIPKVTTVEKRE